MSRAAIANIELGRQHVLLHQLYLLAEALEIDDPSELLPRVEKKGPKRKRNIEISGSIHLTPEQRQEVVSFVTSSIRRPAKRRKT